MKKISNVLPQNPVRQGGPTSEIGKAISSKNATKDGIFVKGLLPWEDPQELAGLMQGLQQQWGSHASARLLMLPIEQAYIELQRLMVAQKNRIEGAMLSLDIARQFCCEAGIELLMASQLPNWYFLENDGGEKDYAQFVDRAQEQALDLKGVFQDRLVPTIEHDFPDLYRYVMEGYAKNQSFLSILGHRYRQSTPTLNLGVVSNEIGEKFRFHLIWAQAPLRYETIIKSIRSEQAVESMNLEKYSRYLTRCQNTISKGIQTLALLKETLRLEQEHNVRFDLEQSAIDLNKASVALPANACSYTIQANGGKNDK